MQVSPGSSPIDAPSSSPGSHGVPLFAGGGTFAFTLVTGLFFIWGLSNNLTDILVQQFRKSFTLSQLEAQLVQTAVFLGYFLMAMPAAAFMRRYGYRAGILLGLLLFGCGTLLFWPAAMIGRYTPFLIALFIVGCGSATLETAANPLVAEFGPPATSERRLNFAQSFNPIGSITGVLIGTFFIFSGVELTTARAAALRQAGQYESYMHAEIMRVVPTYVGLGIVVLLSALLIARTRFPAFALRSRESGPQGSLRDLLPCTGLWLSVVAQFFYCGAQVTTWSAFIPYVRQYTRMGEREAGILLTVSLVALAAGRMLSIPLMRHFRPTRMISTYALINMALLTVGVSLPGTRGAFAILTTSLFMSIIFPTIFAIGIKGLGANTKLGGSVIVMAVIGGAVFPPLLGLVARVTGSLALGYLVPLGAYLAIAVYGKLMDRYAPVSPLPSAPGIVL